MTNTEVIQKVYAAFNQGDIETILANLHSDAKWLNYGPSVVPYFGDFTGRITAFFQAIDESTTGGNVSVDRYIESGDTVIAQARYTATVRNNGVEIDAPLAHIFTLSDGKISSWTGYGDTAAVVAAHTGVAIGA